MAGKHHNQRGCKTVSVSRRRTIATIFLKCAIDSTASGRLTMEGRWARTRQCWRGTAKKACRLRRLRAQIGGGQRNAIFRAEMMRRENLAVPTIFMQDHIEFTGRVRHMN